MKINDVIGKVNLDPDDMKKTIFTFIVGGLIEMAADAIWGKKLKLKALEEEQQKEEQLANKIADILAKKMRDK